jgi:hypothetical protein
MMVSKSTRDPSRRVLGGAVAALLLFQIPTGWADPVVLHFKNGDRVAGTVIFENATNVVLSNAWASSLTVPLDQVVRREPLAEATNTLAAAAVATTPAPVAAAKATPKPAKLAVARTLRTNIKLGMDLIYGERRQQNYYGQVSLAYTRPYDSNPARALRNTLDYRADYVRTDGVQSANRMFGSDKLDFDIGRHTFAYNYLASGYDDVRKIEFQFEVGPGLGYHLIRVANFAANVEGGFSYQSQERVGVPRIEATYARIGQDILWKFDPRVTLTQRSTLLTRVDNPDEMQLRLEANLGYVLVKGVSLNLTALELYDTRPVPGISRNEFQLRSSLGLAF